MGLCLRTTHTQQKALPTLTDSIPSSPCTSSIIFQTLHSSGKSLKLSFGKCLLQNSCLLSQVPLWGVIMSHPALQREQQLLCHVLLSGTSLPVPAGTGYTGISSRELGQSLKHGPPHLKRKHRKCCPVHRRQKKARAAGLAGAKRPPSPALRPQQ